MQARRNAGWAKLERCNHEKIPACIESLLISTGYNTLFGLSAFNKDKIEEIEAYVNDHRELINDLRCCFSKEYQA